MAKGKRAFYAVKIGRKPGIYFTWAECKAQVHAFKGALYKKFEDREGAEAFMAGDHMAEILSVAASKDSEKENLLSAKGNSPDSEINAYGREIGDFDPEKIEEGHLHAFVDGSFNAKEAKYGYGLVLFSPGDKEIFYGTASDEGVRHRNVAGEILGAEIAMDKALEKGAKELVIYHDYSGLRHWALKEWRAKLPFTQAYAKKAEDFQKKCKLSFVKVAAHKGVKYNEEADLLAKKGAGIQ